MSQARDLNWEDPKYVADDTKDVNQIRLFHQCDRCDADHIDDEYRPYRKINNFEIYNEVGGEDRMGGGGGGSQ